MPIFRSVYFFLFFSFIFLTSKSSVFAQVTSETTTDTTSKPFKAQLPSPYQLRPKKEISLFSTAIGVNIVGLSFAQSIEPLTVEEISGLRPTDIRGFGFDRNTVRHFSGRAHTTSDIFLFGSLSFPLLLMTDKSMRKDYLKIGVMASQAFLLNAGLTTLTKATVQRTRPFAYNPLVSDATKMTKSTKMSFFSGHTSVVSTLSFFSAKVYADYHPNSKWKPVVWTTAALLPAATGYLRYRAGKHFPTDVVVGYGVGAAIGVLIPHLHRSKKERSFKVSPMAGQEIIGLSLRGVF
ncbi:MAG: phosphatase PAP2 family protein [Bacteroidota bacterium]